VGQASSRLKNDFGDGRVGMTAITALTAQNTTEVYGVVEMPPEFVVQQIEVCVSDIGCDAVKTGMLSGAGLIEVVATSIRKYRLDPLVVDPVMIAKSGAPLLKPDAIDALKTQLLALATIITPNLHEAGSLAGRDIQTLIWLSLVKQAKPSRHHAREWLCFRLSVLVHRSIWRHDVLATVDAADIRGLGSARLLCVAELPRSSHGHRSRSCRP
jgi:Phosphomethylpyrimidine kinase